MAETMTSLDSGRLLRLLTEQRDLYARLQDLSSKQRATIRGDRPDLLLTILRDRQQLVSALAQANERLAPFRRNWDGLFSTLDEGTRTRVTSLLSEIRAFLKAIMVHDHEDSALLSARKQLVANEMADLSGGRTANAAYARQSSASVAGSADLSG